MLIASDLKPFSLPPSGEKILYKLSAGAQTGKRYCQDFLSESGVKSPDPVSSTFLRKPFLDNQIFFSSSRQIVVVNSLWQLTAVAEIIARGSGGRNSLEPGHTRAGRKSSSAPRKRSSSSRPTPCPEAGALRDRSLLGWATRVCIAPGSPMPPHGVDHRKEITRQHNLYFIVIMRMA